MRQPKFRAWDHDDKKIWKVVAISESIWGDCEEAHIKVCEFDKSPEAKETDVRLSVNYDLMQWTGLKDKNGREIYEGDIVNFVDFDSSGGHREDREFTGVIKYQSGLYEIWKNNESEFFESDGAFILNHAWLQDDDFEVIGNIYESKELLEKTK